MRSPLPKIADYLPAWSASCFAEIDDAPWLVTSNAEAVIKAAISGLGAEYVIEGEIAAHRTAIVESGAVLKGPMIIGPSCFVASSAYIRGGCYMGEGCTLGPGTELKTSFMFPGSKLAHLNFVGDSILGSDVNVEAGAMIANYRNERSSKRIRFRHAGQIIDTGVDKFGALVGDHSRIGANAVIAPGAILVQQSIVGRLQLIDQAPPNTSAPTQASNDVLS